VAASSPSPVAVGRGGQHGQRIRAGLDFFANEPHVPEELLELPIDPDATPRQRHAPDAQGVDPCRRREGARVRAATRS
jgi:hypothetical protein